MQPTTHRRLIGPAATVLLLVSACGTLHSNDRDRAITSAELERVGERDTVYLRRVRRFERIAATIPRDTLVQLYVGALAATPDRAWIYQHALACQTQRMVRAYGFVAASMAVRQVEDSLFPPPKGKRRWADATSRWPSSLGPGYHCDTSDLPLAPDSLDVQPSRTH